jgi:signal transduction histidine kinase
MAYPAMLFGPAPRPRQSNYGMTITGPGLRPATAHRADLGQVRARGRDALAALVCRVGVPLVANVAALGLAFLLDPLLHQGVFVLFLGAVTLSAWHGGLGSGLLATAGGALAFNYLLTEPMHALWMPGRGSADLAVFGLVSLLITFLYVQLREAHRREMTARHTAEEAIRLRDGFLAAVAHDFKSPLSTILGTCQLVSKRSHDAEARNNTERWSAAVARIETAARRLAAQVDQLLDVAHTEAGRPLGLRRVPEDLVALVRRVVAQHEGTSARHQLRVEANPERLIGSFDPVRLERVVDNLVTNAIKYSPLGGAVTLTVRCQAAGDGTWAVLSVCDEGLGIPAADLPCVFEPFRRASNVGPIRGTGIGLASARQVVEEHGGRIVVTSREGTGTTVVVSLPLDLGTTNAAQDPDGGRKPEPQSPTISAVSRRAASQSTARPGARTAR